MTGLEHYRRAEQLLREDLTNPSSLTRERAQVHATLALASAQGCERHTRTSGAWVKQTGETVQ